MKPTRISPKPTLIMGLLWSLSLVPTLLSWGFPASVSATDLSEKPSLSPAAIAQYRDDYASLFDLCYQSHGQRAVEACDRAISINPNEFATWINRGTRLLELARYEESLDSYKGGRESPVYARPG